ncbi:MAG TPA: class I SAM-dependent methyltransferase, partial [Acidimicrobiales bacterium]|nr:class I SAM-dependent methyltransferase [Acidimicrobiales bacterium]
MAAPDPDSPSVVYERLRWNTPLSPDHATLLLGALDDATGEDVLDLGCGWGELLIEAVGRVAHGQGTGVDNAEWAIERARRVAGERGFSQRTRFVLGDCSQWADASDRVLCIGASHAWGGSERALGGLVGNVRPGGRLVFGDGFWQEPPSRAAT